MRSNLLRERSLLIYVYDHKFKLFILRSLVKSLKIELDKMSLRSCQRRNRSKIVGRKAHCYEFFYSGRFCQDMIITIDIYINATSDHYCIEGPRPTMFEVAADSVGSASTPDRCFEFVGILRSFFDDRALERSIFCTPDTHGDLFDILDASEMISDVYEKTPLEDLVSLYGIYKPNGLEDTDHLYMILNLI